MRCTPFTGLLIHHDGRPGSPCRVRTWSPPRYVMAAIMSAKYYPVRQSFSSSQRWSGFSGQLEPNLRSNLAILSIPKKESDDESQTKKPQHCLQGQGECRKRPLNCSTLRWRERKRRPPVNTRFFGMVVINLAPNWLVGRTSIDLSLRGPRSWDGWYWRGRVGETVVVVGQNAWTTGLSASG